MERFKNQLVLFIILLFFWILWNNSLDYKIWLYGFFVSLLVVLLFGKKLEIFSGVKLTPAAIGWSLYYIMVFVWAVIRSNIDVFFRVLHPKLPIRPGIVRVETRLKSPMGRLILANSITLTPGTFIVDIKEKYLYVHWIEVDNLDNPEKMACDISCKFEKILLKIYE